MSVKCTSRVWELSDSTGSHRLVLLAIADFANEDGVGWPGQARLAEMTQISTSSVKRVISDLVEIGELWRGRRREGGPNAYIVCVGLTKAELERAKELVVDLGCDQDEVEAAFDPGITHSTTLVLPTVPPGITAMDHDPSLSVTDSPSSGLKGKPLPPLEIEDDYYIELYYNDKQAVNRIGTAKGGPWEVECHYCGVSVTIRELDVWNECGCGMHEFKLLSKKPHTATRERKPESVEAYYAIVKSRGVRYGANPDYEGDIFAAVTDLPFWRQVVKEYIHPAFGGNPHGVDKMLVYYNEKRLPGTRKRKESEAIAPKFKTIEEVEAEMRRKEPEVVAPTLPVIAGWSEPQAAIDLRQELERQRREGG